MMRFLVRAFRWAAARARWLLLLLSAALSACQTAEQPPSINTWSSSPPLRMMDDQSGSARLDGSPLLAKDRGGRTTIIEGTGRFVGHPGADANATLSETGDGDITLNLHNVPTAQAAKTVLGDILNVKYAVDSKVDGKVTIQTPKPVTRTAAVDLFEAALLLNNAVITNKDGVYRVVPSDQAAVGANMRIEDPREAVEQIGSGLCVGRRTTVAAKSQATTASS